MRVGEIVLESAPVIGLGNTIADAAEAMHDVNVSYLVVVDGNGKVAGVLTERNLALGCPLEGHISWKCEVFRHMTIQPEFVSRTDDSTDAALTMIEKELNHLPVVDDGKVLGLILSSDVFEAREREASYMAVA